MRLLFAILAYCLSATLLVLDIHGQVNAQQREFPAGALRVLEQLPQGRFRDQIARLPASAKERAIAWLANIHFTEADTHFMHVDTSGGVYFVDPAPVLAAEGDWTGESFPIAYAAVPMSPFPANLIFHSKPGAPNVIYLNFSGETVMNTAWNDSLGRSLIPAVAYSSDTDLATFSDAEQLAIRGIWQRVAEDYAAFDVDVTTERPGTFTTRTAHALITRHTDANGQDNPAAQAGGVAYVGVFATSSYAKYRPAWIYNDNLGNEESFIAEAVSHEIGHNIGLTHDGRTDGLDYYGGHGSGEISWGPIMGTGYNRNVSQWSKGEYYLANNTQDDLATLAGKLSYRTDDHAGTFGSATPLTIFSSGAISSTTPETDPVNSSQANKGRIERNSDVDVFSFATGAGTVSIAVNPWITPNAYTRGGNLDLLVELFNASGQLLLQNNASDRTGALVQTNLAQGVYYLSVKPTGTGSPLSSTPSGYTSFASVGQYFISGSVVANTIVLPPGAELAVTDLIELGLTTKSFTVTYSDDVAVDVSTIGGGDIRVTGPNGFDVIANFVSIDSSIDGSPRVATYSVDSPGTVWAESDNGTYSVMVLSNAVADTQGAFVPANTLGTFNVSVPRTIYFANLDSNPGWTLAGLWQYGLPSYLSGSAPLSGYTGLNIIGYNLSGNYENRLAAVYAATPPINCAGASTATLQFRRWLRVRNGDTANIQISTNGTSWSDLWSNEGAVIADSSWQLVQYSLPPAFAASSTLQIRWGMASGQTQNDIGWNIDDIAILGGGELDTTPPTATFAAANITSGGSPVHTVSVTYTDNVAVQVSSLGSTDLLVVGPNGTNIVQFEGVDVSTEGTPRTALYSLAAPNGTWESSDNGQYNVYLEAGEVADTSNNFLDSALLGSFTVAISTVQQALIVEPSQLSITEGSQESFTVRLAAQPSATVTVITTGPTGDSDLLIVSGSTNIFTTDNWNVPADVTIAALPDEDQINGSAIFVCQSEGLASVNITATEQDTTPTPPVITLTSPVNGSEFLSTDTIQFAAEATDDGSIAKVEFFAGATLLGSDSTTPYTLTSTLPPGSYLITAKATDNDGATATSSAVSITVTAPNQPPVVSLTAPADGATFLTTDNVTVSASASDDETVSKVDFFANGTLIGSDSAAPFTVTTTLAAGNYFLTATATDNDGAATTSSAVTITVSTPNQPPTVAITAPAQNATFLTTDNVTVSASASDDETVSKVDFFANGTLISSDSAAPFTVTTTLAAGNYFLTATATDNDGAATTSSAVTITVSTPNQPPTVAITAPAQNATFLTTDNVTVSADAIDDEIISKVDFFANGTLIGSDSAAPFSVTTTLAAGTHSLTATALDNDGATTTSSAVTITVTTPNQPPTVAIISPASSATVVEGETVVFAIDASDDGSIARVELILSDQVLGICPTSPYQFSTNFSAGAYQVIARAIDDHGLSSTSAPVLLEVTAPIAPPEFLQVYNETGSITFSATTSSGADHILQASSDFQSWLPIATNTPISGTITFQLTPPSINQFYRLVILP